MIIKYLFFFALITKATSSYTQPNHHVIFIDYDMEEQSYEWANQLPQLHPQEIALLANFLYFSVLVLHFEHKVRSTLLEASQILTLHKYQHNEYGLHTHAMQIIKDLQELTSELLPTRTYAKKAWEACLDEIEKSEYDNLKEILFIIQKTGQEILQKAAQTSSNEITDCIQANALALIQVLQALHISKGILQSLAQHDYPFEDSQENLPLLEMDQALDTTAQLYETTHELAFTAGSIQQMSLDMLVISTVFFKNYYSAFYAMVSNTHEKIPLMFDEDGLIPFHKQYEYLPEF